MDDHSQFLNQLRKRALGTNENVHAEDKSTDLHRHSSENAQGERSDASDASDRQGDSGQATPAGLDAVQACSVCDENLRRLPERITQGGFRHSTIPVHLCSVCDGEALMLSSRQFDE
jgi:hypothetical protein